MGYNIAIDGPSGAGKSTLSRAAAKSLGYIYVDTGALYRTIGLYVYRNGINVGIADDVVAVLSKVSVDITFKGDEQRVLLNGEDVSEDIRMHIISDYASKVSAIPAVRSFLLDMQRDFAKKYNVIMDGRDIGTVVLPDADVKIYLTASAEVRAKRRYNELVAKGDGSISFEQVLSDVIERDNRDMNREVAPLKVADDAVVVDTSDLQFDESLNAIVSVIKERVE